jgi:hypothetical protein
MAQVQDPRLYVPTIRILFDGLFFLCFDTEENPSNECQIGALTTASDHELTVTIVESVEVKKGSGQHLCSHKTFTLHPSMSRYIGHLRLNVQSKSRRIEGVERYGYDHGDPLPSRDSELTYPANFKWILDFENGEFHADPLDIAEGVFNPVLHINTGLFYSDTPSSKKYDLVKADVATKPFGVVARTMGANIELEEDDEIVLERREGEDCEGEDCWVPLLPLARNPDATYLIHLQNVCPKCKTEVRDTVELAKQFQTLKTPDDLTKHLEKRMEELVSEDPDHPKDPKPIPPDGHSDFRCYYGAFRNYSGVEQYDFQLSVERGLSPSICYSVSGSKSREIP